MISGSKRTKRSIRYAIFCHIFEHYENSLFVFIAPFIASVFFPLDALGGARLDFYSVNALAALLSPFGATFFSWIGDKYGRQKALIYSMMLSIIPMMIVGFIPPYERVGLLSSLLLMVCRFAQALGVGGAFFATVTLVTESSTEKKNLHTGILMSMGFVGSLLGTFLSAFFMMEDMPSYAWRFSFFIGGIMGFYLYKNRHQVSETELWEKAQKSSARVPFLSAIQKYPSNVFSVFLFGTSVLLPFYIIVSWLPGYLEDTLHFGQTWNMIISTMLLTISGASMILFCWLASFLDLKRMIYTSIFFECGLALILFEALSGTDYPLILTCQIAIALMTSLQGSAVFILIQALFPVRYKYSGFAIPFSVGKVLLTISSPMIAEFIFKYTHQASYISYLLFIPVPIMLLATVIAKPIQERYALL